MLGERTFTDPSNPSIFRSISWYDTGWPTWTVPQYWQALAFPYPTTPAPISPTVMASTHGSTVTRTSSGVSTAVGGTVVVVTYFDGHGAILPSDTPFP
jgi:hypothetical protein